MADINVLIQRRNSINAKLASLQAKRSGQLNQIESADAEVASLRAQRSRQRAGGDEQGAQFITGLIEQTEAKQDALNAQLSQTGAEIFALEQELAEVNRQINQVQQQQSAAKQSTGETVRQDQIGQAEAANPDKPTPPELKITNNGVGATTATNGRVGPAAAAVPTNAEKFTADSNEDIGTDEPTRRASQTQQTPQSVAAPGGVRPGTPSTSNTSFTSTISAADDARPGGSGPQAANQPGAAAAGDDNTNGVRSTLNRLFSGSTQPIIPKPNILDQYASYSYNISFYMVTRDQYARMMTSKQKNLAGFQLLMRSGGAGPAGTAADIPELSRQERDFVTQSDLINQSLQGLGRNQYFPLDFYMDDLRFVVVGSKAAGGSYNIAKQVDFKIFEPNGISLIPNLYRATQQMVAAQGLTVDRANYLNQIYLLVIRFYGYDENGTLVQAGKTGPDSTGSDAFAISEKFIPIRLRNIKYKIAGKVTEYEVSAVAAPVDINMGVRGVIPTNFEIPATTLKDLFAGNGGAAASAGGTQAFLEGEDQSAAETARLGRSTSLAPGGTPTPNSAVTAGNSPTQGTAPSKANTAPSPKLVAGVMTAMNQFQQQLVDKGVYQEKDEYVMEFTDNILAEATVQPPENTDKKSRPSPPVENARDALLQRTQSVNTAAKTTAATAGMSLVQFIDQYTRSSSYITSQQTRIPKTDAKGNTTYIVQPVRAGQILAWYRIGVQATPLKYDPKRNDYAYRITYQLNPYKINSLDSEFFPNPPFQGVHKQYDYWFTGQNTSILRYEQEINNQYFVTVNAGLTPEQTFNETTDVREYIKRVYQARSSESSQGIQGLANDPAANAADYLFSPADFRSIKMEIVGDPAWIAQGELWEGCGGLRFNYDPFLPDGTINYDAQEQLFEVRFNMPQDYDLNTGLMDLQRRAGDGTSASDRPDQPTQSNIYKLRTITNKFSRGQFTQEIEGVGIRFKLPSEAQAESVNQPTAASTDNSAAARFRQGPDQSDAESARLLRQNAAARTSGRTFAQRQQDASTSLQSARRQAFGDNTASGFQRAPQLESPAAANQAPTSGGQPVGPASSAVAVATQGGASGINVGQPVTVQAYLNNNTVASVSSQGQIDALRQNGQLSGQAASATTDRLRLAQQAANSPTTNAPPQRIVKER
jgi:hypothetical protein